MGFKKSNLAERIEINIIYKNVNDKGFPEDVEVTHFFRRPPNNVREEYNRRLVKVKGRKVKTDTGSANWYMWRSCILKVEGYDDLPRTDTGELDPNWHTYFLDDSVRIHVDDSVNRLMEVISGEDGDEDWEKNSVQFLEQS